MGLAAFPYAGGGRGVQFLKYLYSADNHIWNQQEDLIYQDMHFPLACYFISSSHNTYLMGGALLAAGRRNASLGTILFR